MATAHREESVETATKNKGVPFSVIKYLLCVSFVTTELYLYFVKFIKTLFNIYIHILPLSLSLLQDPTWIIRPLPPIKNLIMAIPMSCLLLLFLIAALDITLLELLHGKQTMFKPIAVGSEDFITLWTHAERDLAETYISWNSIYLQTE